MSLSGSGSGVARRLLVGLATAVLGTVGMAGTASAAPTNIHWFVTGQALSLISGNTGNQTLVTNAFDNSQTDVMGTPPSGWVPPVTQVKGFESLASFNNALPNLASGSWVLYDLESWKASIPDNEDPATSMQTFVTLAHNNGLHVILAPAADLGAAITASSCDVSGEPGWENYLDNCDIPAMVGAAQPDEYEIQSQSLEQCTDDTVSGCATTYPEFVQDSLAQAQTNDAGLTALAGLSTNPNGATSTGQVLDTDTVNTDTTVSGYWLNVPEQGSSCQNCQPGGEPQVAVAYLHDLGYTG